MSERKRRQVEPTATVLNHDQSRAFGHLFNNRDSQFHQQIRAQGGNAVVRHRKVPELDIAFFGPESNNSQGQKSSATLTPVQFHTVPNVIGIMFEDENLVKKTKSLAKMVDMVDRPLSVSVIVATAEALMSASDQLDNPKFLDLVYDWTVIHFYNSLAEVELEQSAQHEGELGKEEAISQFQEQTVQEITEKMDAAKFLLSKLDVLPNTTSAVPFEKGIVIMFKTTDNGVAVVPMMEVLQYPSPDAPITKRTGQVIGIYVPPLSESLAVSVEKSERFKRQGGFPQLSQEQRMIGSAVKNYTFLPLVAIANPEQLSLWRLRGFFGELESYRGEKALPLPPVLDFLEAQFGKNVEIHSRRTYGQEIDGLFINPLEQHPNQPQPLDIVCLSKGKKVIVENVVGFFCCEDGLLDVEIQNIATKGSQLVSNIHPNYKNLKIIGVNARQFGFWCDIAELNQDFFQLSKQAKKVLQTESDLVPPETLALPTMRSVRQVNFISYEHAAPSIGAKPTQIEVEYVDGRKEYITLDMGSQYLREFGWQGMSKPSHELGFDPFLFMPVLYRFYRLSLLIKSAERLAERLFDEGPANFIIVDLFWTLGEDEFRRMVKKIAPDYNITFLISRLKELDSVPLTHQVAILYSHLHADHRDFGGIVGSHIRHVLSEESYAIALSDFFYPAGYFRELLVRRQRRTILTEKTGQTYSPPYNLLGFGEELKLGNGQVSAICLPCEHSIYGSCMFLIIVRDEFGQPLIKILYTGDFRFSDDWQTPNYDPSKAGLTELSLELLCQYGVDVVVTDTTNISEGADNKPSLQVTEEMMNTAFDAAIRTSKGATIVQMAPNNFYDSYLAAQAGIRAGKKVVIDVKRAVLFDLFQKSDEARGGDGFPYGGYNPRLRLGFDVEIYRQPKSSFKSVESSLYAMYPDSIVEAKDIYGHEDEYVFLLPAVPGLVQTMSTMHFSQPVTVVRAHYKTYDPIARSQARDDKKYAQERGWRYLADLDFDRSGNVLSPKSFTDPETGLPRGYRKSGHAKPHHFDAFMKTLQDRAGLREAIGVHGKDRQYAADRMTQVLGPDVTVLRKMDKDGFKKRLA